jgi:hypothetical protein
MAVELRFVAFSGPLYAPSRFDPVGLGLRAILLPGCGAPFGCNAGCVLHARYCEQCSQIE